MAITIDNIIQRLDLMYGTAYTGLLSALGTDVNSPNTAKQLTSDAKSMIRGGSDRIGVVADDNALKVVAFASPTYTVYVNAGNVYFNGVSKSVPTIIVPVGNTDNSGIAFDTSCTATHSCYAAYITCRDTSTTPTVAVTKGYYSVYGLGGATGIAPLPTFPRNDIPLAQIIAQRSIPTGIPYVTDIRPKYEIAPSDAMVTALFTAFDTTENILLAKTYQSDFISAISALNNYCLTVTGQSLRSYTPTYAYSDGFRQLYSNSYGSDLYQTLLLAGPSSTVSLSSYIGKNLYTPANIDVITNTASTWIGTTQIGVFGVVGTYGMLTTPVLTTDSIVYLTNAAGFVTAGQAAIYNYDGSYDYVTYTGKTATSLTGVAKQTKTHKTGDSIYGVIIQNVYIPSGAAQNVAYAVGTSTTKFYSVLSATYNSVGTSSAQTLIRNH